MLYYVAFQASRAYYTSTMKRQCNDRWDLISFILYVVKLGINSFPGMFVVSLKIRIGIIMTRAVMTCKLEAFGPGTRTTTDPKRGNLPYPL